MIKFRNNDKSIGLNKIHVMILFMNKRLIKSWQPSVSVRKEFFNLKTFYDNNGLYFIKH